jgi:transposase
MNEYDKLYYEDAYLLFKRLKEKWHQHLAFVNNNVPYTNNMIERDFRHMKTKMKTSGSFRSWNHLIAFALIYSFLKTCSKRNINLWKAMNQVWTGEFSFK